MQGRVGLTSGAMHIFFVQVLSFVLLLSMWLGLNGAAQAATSEWVDVSASADIYTSNPLRSRRSPDATVTVNVTNTSGAVLDAPLRLVLSQFTPSSVSLEGASGTTSAGDPYLNLSSALAAGESTGNITLKILGGGTTSFNFVPVLEQEQTSTPDPLTVQILEPATLITVGASPIEVSGTVSDDTASLMLNGAAVSFSNGQFSALVSLEEGLNNVVARAVRSGEETTDSIVVSLDATPPYITVETPADGSTVYTSTIFVSGLVNDIVRGTVSEGEANVTVNNVVATVANRSYLAQNIALVEGENTITVQGSDNVGNVGQTTITVYYEIPKPKRIELMSGQNQQSTIQTQLSEPLAVKLLDSDGNPATDKNVVFRVIQGDGVLAPGSTDESQGLLVKSDATGTATTTFKLGSRAGNGTHRVRARAVGFDGEVIFHASATPTPGDKISIIDGNNQRGAVNQPLSKPLVVAVTDKGANLVAEAEVQFEVTRGEGKFQNGLSTYTTTTDTDGRASAELTLGPDVGLDLQRVTATLVGTAAAAGFTVSGLEVGDPGQTTITGVVLDNQDNPVPGVTIRVDGTTRQAVADSAGQFEITEVPVGPVHLLADGSTATVEGEWPTLSYNLVTVAGAVNPLPAPIYIVKLDTENAVTVGDEDVEYTLPEIPGFKLTVKAGSVTFPDGSKSGQISVTTVNANKVPMPPPNGMQPQFIVTIQPAGAKFDPPAPLTIPNVDGHAPGAQVEMYSYDHDLEEFVTIGLGTVSGDGSVIESNPGVGVIKAGWHCGSQPGGSGCCSGGGGGGGCPTCQKSQSGDCNNDDCVPDDSQDPGQCKKCSGGSPVNDDSEDLGECKECKNGAPANKDGACDDGKYCTSADGESPGADQCKDGKCEGKEIKRVTESEVIAEANFNKLRDILQNVNVLDKISVGCSPKFEWKGQRKVQQVKECCETEKRIIDNQGVEENIFGDGSITCVTPQMLITTPWGIFGIQFEAKGSLRGKYFETEFLPVCSDPEQCLTKTGVTGTLFGEGGIIGSVFPIPPAVFSITGSLRVSGSGSLSKACGPWQGQWCAGPVSVRLKATFIGFSSGTFAWVVPGTRTCTEAG